jgi:hypothetical protein
MKILSILVGSLLLVGCGNSNLPPAPSIKTQYSIAVREGVAYCLQYEIQSVHPYKVKFNKVVELVECNNLNGFNPHDITLMLNYVDDLYSFADAHKKCLVK